LAEQVDGDERREGERQRDREEQPRGEELGEDRLPGGDRQGEQELERARTPLLGPDAHSHRGHEYEIEPRMPAEKGREARLAPLEEVAGGEGEEAGEQQEDDEEDVGHRRSEIGDELALGDDPDDLHAFAVSGSVMRRNTSSSSPRSLYMPSTFQPWWLTSS